MRSKTTLLLTLSAAFVLALAHAKPPIIDPDGKGGGPGGGGGGKPGAAKLLRAHSAFASRMKQPVAKNGTSLTREQIIQKFNPDDQIDIEGGKKITIQDLLDRVGDAEDEATKAGTSLTKLKKSGGWFKAASATKLMSQKGMVMAEAQAVETAKAKLNIAGAAGINSCSPGTCTPRDKEKTAKFEKQKGDEDTLAVYTSFAITEQTPTGDSAKCTATWDNGAYLMGSKHSLVKLTGEAASQKKPQVQTSGKTALYLLGQASPVWSKEGKVTGDSLDRTFKTPKASLGITFIPLVSVEGGIMASATLSLKPTVTGDAAPTSVGCTIGLTPRLQAEVDPEVKIVVGIKKLLEIATGGVKANIVMADVSFPTQLGVRMTETPLQLGVNFKSDVKASFLKGKVVAWYKIKDICAWGYCLIEDGLGIDTSGEVVLWEDADGINFNSNLVSINGNIPFVNPNAPNGMMMSPN